LAPVADRARGINARRAVNNHCGATAAMAAAAGLNQTAPLHDPTGATDSFDKDRRWIVFAR